MKCLVALLTACAGSSPAPRTHVDPAACDLRTPSTAQVGFEDARRIVELRVVEAVPGPAIDAARCVELVLEVVEQLRGDGPEAVHDRLRVVVRQALATTYRDRPAGAWWVVEQELVPGRELIAFCPDAGAVLGQLRERCTIERADGGALADLRLARDADRDHLDLAGMLRRAHAQCRAGSYLLAHAVWSRHGAEAMRDPRAFEQVAALLEDRACAPAIRGTLLERIYSAVTVAEDLPRARILAAAMFRLLGMPEAAAIHDELVQPYLPNLLGLAGMSLSPDALRAGRAALDGYRGSADAAPLRAWLDRR